MTELSEPTRQTPAARIIAERRAEHRVPGIAAGVARDGELLWSDGVGAADLASSGRPPTDDTQFLIASNTKTFTAVLVMALRDEGKLSLDDTVEQHVPESKHGGITIRQMLSHVTGMQREPVGDVWDTLTYPDRDRAGRRAGTQAERILKPHYKWHYSNLVFAMLGEIVARIDGREWAESLQARILDPLEMRRTTVGLTEQRRRRLLRAAVQRRARASSRCSTSRRWTRRARSPARSRTWRPGASFLADPVDEVLQRGHARGDVPAADHGRPRALAARLGSRPDAASAPSDRVWVGHDGGMPGHITGLLVHRPVRDRRRSR